jgi:hypothetical protein
MKDRPLAYLVLAHQHPAHLARMVRALESPAARFHIHVDAKADLQAFMHELPPSESVTYVPDRVDVQWMGYSIVEATLRLVRQALRDEFSYALMLSGADYPIKPREQIEAFYASASEEFLCFWRLEDRPEWLHKIRYFYPVDLVPIRGWSTGTEPSWWRRFFWGRWYMYRKYMPKRRFFRGVVPYGGPDWWALSRPCLEYVVDFVRRNPSFARFYRYTEAPSEMFLHTVIMNSPFEARVRNRARYEAWRGERQALGGTLPRLPEDSFHFRYVDWSGEADGLREKPAVLDDRDWDALASTHCHFARKFDPVRSATLLERVDSILLEDIADAAIA